MATALIVFTSSAVHADALQFSAAVAYSVTPATAEAPPASAAKLYVGKDKIRIDFAGVVGHSLIVDETGHTIVAVLPARRAFQSLESRPAEYFRIENGEDACPAWQRAAGTLIRCEKVGPELVEGRRTIRYVRTLDNGSVDEMWVDPTLQFAVK